jgi:hypothetical protein
MPITIVRPKVAKRPGMSSDSAFAGGVIQGMIRSRSDIWLPITNPT